MGNNRSSPLYGLPARSKKAGGKAKELSAIGKTNGAQQQCNSTPTDSNPLAGTHQHHPTTPAAHALQQCPEAKPLHVPSPEGSAPLQFVPVLQKQPPPQQQQPQQRNLRASTSTHSRSSVSTGSSATTLASTDTQGLPLHSNGQQSPTDLGGTMYQKAGGDQLSPRGRLYPKRSVDQRLSPTNPSSRLQQLQGSSSLQSPTGHNGVLYHKLSDSQPSPTRPSGDQCSPGGDISQVSRNLCDGQQPTPGSSGRSALLQAPVDLLLPQQRQQEQQQQQQQQASSAADLPFHQHQQQQQQQLQQEHGHAQHSLVSPHSPEPHIIHASRIPKSLREEEAAGNDAEDVKALLEASASYSRLGLSKRELRHSYSAPGDCNEAKSVILSLIYGRYIPKGKRLPQAQDSSGQVLDTHGPKQGHQDSSASPTPSPKPIRKMPLSRNASLLGVGSPALAEQFALIWGGGSSGKGRGSRRHSSRRSSRTPSFSAAPATPSSSFVCPSNESSNQALLALQRRRARKDTYKPSQLSRALVSSFRFSQQTANPEKVIAAECLRALNTGKKTRHASMLLAALPALGGLDDELETDLLRLHKESKVAGSSNESQPTNRPSTLELLREARRRAMDDGDEDPIECAEPGLEECTPTGAKIPVTPSSTASSSKTTTATGSSASRARTKLLRTPSLPTSPPAFGSLSSPNFRTAPMSPPLHVSASARFASGTVAGPVPPANHGLPDAQLTRADRWPAVAVSPKGAEAAMAVTWSDSGAGHALSSSSTGQPYSSAPQPLSHGGLPRSGSLHGSGGLHSSGRLHSSSGAGQPLSSKSSTGSSTQRTSSSHEARKVKHSVSFGASSTSSMGVASTAKLNRTPGLLGRESTPAVPSSSMVHGDGSEGTAPCPSSAMLAKSPPGGRQRDSTMGLLSQALVSSCTLNPDQPVCKLVAVNQMPSSKKSARHSSSTMASQLQAMSTPCTSSQRRSGKGSHSEGCNVQDAGFPGKVPYLPKKEEATPAMLDMARP